MAYQLDPKDLVDFRELLMVNTIQVDTCIQKGYFTEAEFLEKMKWCRGITREMGRSAVKRGSGPFNYL